ncbi:MAG: tRNA uridine-5-carboxymethylaminomethyl(34) synthesis GTPase MnmE [Pseudomonadota bacterium]
MEFPPDEVNDNIAAISTPIGAGGIAIIRLSGPGSWDLAARIFIPYRRGPARSHLMRLGEFIDPRDGRVMDQILCALMSGPHTYTGEDLAEFHVHGGPLNAARVLEACLEAGARAAEPGEFTRRAFLSGRIDLTQAEATAELISARGLAEADLAAAQLRGGIKEKIQQIRDVLVRILAELEVALDFSEEDVEIIDGPASALVLRREALVPLDRLLDDHRSGGVFREGVRAALVGRPNVGKSSLFNALAGRDAAIVTNLPGTTRDALELPTSLFGIPLTLIDTAGLESPPRDEAEAEGQRRAAARLAEADLALLVLDGSRPLGPEDRRIFQLCPPAGTVIVINKIDLPRLPPGEGPPEFFDPALAREVSALTGEGLGELRRTIFARLTGSRELTARPPELVINLRHKRALEEARPALERAGELLQTGGPLELTALELHLGLEALGKIIGLTTPEDVLDEVFSRFCLGK